MHNLTQDRNPSGNSNHFPPTFSPFPPSPVSPHVHLNALQPRLSRNSDPWRDRLPNITRSVIEIRRLDVSASLNITGSLNTTRSPDATGSPDRIGSLNEIRSVNVIGSGRANGIGRANDNVAACPLPINRVGCRSETF
jgi:hypothetical protein